MRGTTTFAVLLSFLWFGFRDHRPLPAAASPSPPPAECTLTVEAGPDVLVCQPGQTVPLTAASAGGQLLAVRWSPGTQVLDSTSLSTSAIARRSGTYRVTVYSVQPENLIVNGDFSLGDFGFRSDYRYGNSRGAIGILAEESQYAVADNPRSVHRSFTRCYDHTTGNGNMMIVNASGQADDVWCQTIQVKPNTDYVFTAWVASAVSQNPARLRFSINGAQLGQELQASSRTCEWRQAYALWNSGSSTLAEICIANVNFTAAGNDFLLDDIAFSPVCVATDSVSVRVADLRADWTAPATLCQNEAAFALDVLLDSTATPGGRWTLDGQPAVAVDPARLAAGAHTLNYLVEDGNCRAERAGSFTVTATPSAGITLPELRLCRGADTLLDLRSRLRDAAAGGRWSETSSILSGAAFNPAAATVRTAGLAPGTYAFTYTLDAPAPCTGSTATVSLIIDPAPVADAGEDQAIDCVVNSVQLGGAGTGQDPDVTLSWTGPDGRPLPSSDSAPEVDQPGVYTLTAVDNRSGCRTTDEVLVVSNITTPVPRVTVRPITCFGDTDGAILIDDVADGQPPFVYAIDDGPMTPKNQFEGLGPGRYQLKVEDLNGCTATTEVVIEQPAGLSVTLEANLPGSQPILPLGDSVLLKALVSIPPDRVASVDWGPDAGACTDCLTRRVRPVTPTRYSVTVTDVNGCTASDDLDILIARRKNAFVPNAFSPNNDGINDVLMIYAGQEVARVRYFRVLSRWGAVVYNDEDFAPNDPTHGWDGTFRGEKLRGGVFVYSAELELVDGTPFLLTGDVTLVK